MTIVFKSIRMLEKRRRLIYFFNISARTVENLAGSTQLIEPGCFKKKCTSKCHEDRKKKPERYRAVSEKSRPAAGAGGTNAIGRKTD